MTRTFIFESDSQPNHSQPDRCAKLHVCVSFSSYAPEHCDIELESITNESAGGTLVELSALSEVEQQKIKAIIDDYEGDADLANAAYLEHGEALAELEERALKNGNCED